MKELKYLPVITGIYVSALILTPPLASKFISIGPLVIVGATLVFPIVFIVNDILTEVYGYKRSRSVIWTGLFMQVFAALMYALVVALPYPEFWKNQAAFEAVMGSTPRIALASITAYFLGEITNSFILSKMKYWQAGKVGIRQQWRFVLSTFFGEGVDTAVFLTLAFLFVMPTHILLTTIVTVWLFKVGYEIVALPFSTRIANWLKKQEGVDHIDRPGEIDYNPFKV